MQTHAKKRIEIIIEAPSLRRLTELLDQLSVGGYTILPALGGKGRESGNWSREGLVSDAGRMVLVLCVLDQSRVDEVLDKVYALVSRQIGIVTISDVQVIRKEHF